MRINKKKYIKIIVFLLLFVYTWRHRIYVYIYNKEKIMCTHLYAYYKVYSFFRNIIY